MTELPTLDVMEVMRRIPHRYPMLLIDRLRIESPGEQAVGIKNVTINEPYFQGHFPDEPVMPGVLIIEAIAQSAGALVVYTLGDEGKGRLVYFMSIDNAKFRRPVRPGDVLELHVTKQRSRGNVWRFGGKAMVNDTLVAEAVISAMLVPKSEG